jgi:hypothetical protein
MAKVQQIVHTLALDFILISTTGITIPLSPPPPPPSSSSFNIQLSLMMVE